MGLIYCVVSYWGYPQLGGGEQWLYDTMIWAKEEGLEPVWLCFANPNPKEQSEFPRTNMIEVECGTIFQIGGGYSDSVLSSWLEKLRPRIVHHQGKFRIPMMRVCKNLDIPFVTGLHFWEDSIDLNKSSFNVDILKNKKYHKESNNLATIQEADVLYVASEFVQRVIEEIANVKIPLVWHPVSPPSRVLATTPRDTRKFVTMINIHKLKGGDILLHCIRTLHHIPFIIVKTEYMSDITDANIQQAVAMRNSKPNLYAPCKIMARTNDIKSIYADTKILLVPSQVDETFCKVAQEGLLNGIPIIASNKGYLDIMLKDTGIIIDDKDPKKWSDVLRTLYDDEKTLDNLSNLSKFRSVVYNEKEGKKKFNKILTLALAKKARVMLFVPWADQGLGIQARNYVKFFLDIGVTPFIFSFRSYFTKSNEKKYQKNESEWNLPNIPVYYSENDRENVTDREIIAFLRKFEVSHAIIPETCFPRVFEIAKLLREKKVWVYGIPNLETVRNSEIHRHQEFDLILANNKQTLDRFNELGFEDKTMHIGYTIHEKARGPIKPTAANVKFLCICGLNSVVRKQASKVCESFLQALRKVGRGISLTLTIQGAQIPDDIAVYSKIAGIKVIKEHLSHKDIMELYKMHHVVIQVSKHEGLGLGFYEAISTGTPVLTLDTAPHNEIIKDGNNGWLTKCHYTAMTDNNDGIMESADFLVEDLVEKILEIKNNYKFEMVKKIIDDYHRRFSQKDFKKRWRKIFFLNSESVHRPK